MITQTRNGVFETNSSSSHVLCMFNPALYDLTYQKSHRKAMQIVLKPCIIEHEYEQFTDFMHDGKWGLNPLRVKATSLFSWTVGLECCCNNYDNYDKHFEKWYKSLHDPSKGKWLGDMKDLWKKVSNILKDKYHLNITFDFSNLILSPKSLWKSFFSIQTGTAPCIYNSMKSDKACFEPSIKNFQQQHLKYIARDYITHWKSEDDIAKAKGYNSAEKAHLIFQYKLWKLRKENVKNEELWFCDGPVFNKAEQLAKVIAVPTIYFTPIYC